MKHHTEVVVSIVRSAFDIRSPQTSVEMSLLLICTIKPTKTLTLQLNNEMTETKNRDLQGKS